MNSILLVLMFATLGILVAGQTSDVFADVISPKKQTNIGIDQTDVICKADLVKVHRINTNSIDCFTPTTAQKLMDRGLVLDVSKDKLDAKKSLKQNPSIGTVTGLATVKQFGSEGKLSTDKRVIDYLYVFEVCANDKTIRLPEILVTSDSEAKTVKLAKRILANTCYTSSAVIKATSLDSIAGTITNKGIVSDKITELEMTVSSLQQKLDASKKSLADIAKQDSSSLTAESKIKISEITNEIVKLRAELNQAKGELNKYLYALNAPQLKSSQFTKQKLTFTGAPIKDTSASIISISRQTTGNTDSPDTTSGSKLYNVVFEACAGNEIVRVPEVRVDSDSEAKIVRVSEKISPNTCQMSTAKVNAVDTNSIKIEIANRADISFKIVELEKKIDVLISEQSTYQIQLNKLVVQSEKPADYEEQITDLSSKIIQLRNEIRDAKFQMYGNIYDVYRTG